MIVQNRLTMFRHTLKTIHEFSKEQDNNSLSDIKCISLMVEKKSVLNGKSLQESEMGKRNGCFVVGQESNSTISINPPASTVFSTGDVLWIIGDKEIIYSFIKENLHI